eukprot:5914924-Prymnesium_polylepis.1
MAAAAMPWETWPRVMGINQALSTAQNEPRTLGGYGSSAFRNYPCSELPYCNTRWKREILPEYVRLSEVSYV